MILLAKQSHRAAEIMLQEGFPGFAASRAYYAMFYVAQAFLLEKEMAFSKHSGTISGFGKEFCATGIVPAGLHRFLIEAQKHRLKADYSASETVEPDIALQQVQHAAEFITVAERILGTVSEEE
ncbi:MAG: HEPN domain-containing protein [bacterium]|nr:HEPN domain-containing protein [bacterium]